MGRKIDVFALIVIIFLLGIIAYFLYSNDLISNPDVLINFIRNFGVFSYFAFFLIVVLEVVVAPIPGAIIYTVGGILFGPLLGGTLALVANIIGSVIAFYIGKKIILDEEAIKKKDRLDKMVSKYGGYSIFLLRVNPLTSSDIFSFLAGVLRMDFKKFILGTTLALAPLVYLQSYLGEEIFLKSKALFSVLIIASIVYVIGFILFLIKKKLIKAPEIKSKEDNGI